MYDHRYTRVATVVDRPQSPGAAAGHARPRRGTRRGTRPERPGRVRVPVITTIGRWLPSGPVSPHTRQSQCHTPQSAVKVQLYLELRNWTPLSCRASSVRSSDDLHNFVSLKVRTVARDGGCRLAGIRVTGCCCGTGPPTSGSKMRKRMAISKLAPKTQ